MPRWVDCKRVTFKYGLGEEFIDVLKTLHKLGPRLEGAGLGARRRGGTARRGRGGAPDPATLGDRMHGKTCAGTFVTGTGQGRRAAVDLPLPRVRQRADDARVRLPGGRAADRAEPGRRARAARERHVERARACSARRRSTRCRSSTCSRAYGEPHGQDRPVSEAARAPAARDVRRVAGRSARARRRAARAPAGASGDRRVAGRTTPRTSGSCSARPRSASGSATRSASPRGGGETRGCSWSRSPSSRRRASSGCTRSRRRACCWARTPASSSRRRSGSRSRALFAAASGLPLRPAAAERVLRWAWALIGRSRPCSRPGRRSRSRSCRRSTGELGAEQLDGWQITLAVIGVVLYATAAFGYFRLYRRRRARSCSGSRSRSRSWPRRCS